MRAVAVTPRRMFFTSVVLTMPLKMMAGHAGCGPPLSGEIVAVCRQAEGAVRVVGLTHQRVVREEQRPPARHVEVEADVERVAAHAGGGFHLGDVSERRIRTGAIRLRRVDVAAPEPVGAFACG